MNQANSQSDVRVIKASLDLQKKVGTGKLDEQKVALSQKVIEENNVDFGPMAMDFLKKLEDGVKAARAGQGDTKDLIAGMTNPVMQMKANAQMFKYDMVTSLANIMLNFLEGIKEMDNDVIEIVDAHRKTLTLIIMRKMSGTGGEQGKILVTELVGACARYFTKKGIKPQ